MRGLLHQLGISENERLMGMTDAAIRSMYVDTENHTSYLGMCRCILYKWFLQLRLWWGDLFTEWYYRWYLSQQKELFFTLDEGAEAPAPVPAESPAPVSVPAPQEVGIATA